MRIMENIELRNLYMQKPISKSDDLYFKCVCFYNTMTEIYDRGLTSQRSPYDETEAFVIGENARYSNRYAQMLYCAIMDYISYKTNSAFDKKRWNNKMNNNNYSAQQWIDLYLRFCKEKDEEIVELLMLEKNMKH